MGDDGASGLEQSLGWKWAGASREFFEDVRSTLLWGGRLVESVWGESDGTGWSLLSSVLIASLGWVEWGQHLWRWTQISSGLGGGNFRRETLSWV